MMRAPKVGLEVSVENWAEPTTVKRTKIAQ